MTDSVHYAPIGSLTLAYETFGKAANPPVVLIMGLGAQMLVWPDALCEHLARQGYYVVRFDNRDVGLSSRFHGQGESSLGRILFRMSLGLSPRAGYELDTMAGDTLGLMDHLGLSSAHIIGASMGGMIAQVIASHHPSRVRSLGLIMSNSGAPGIARADWRLLAGVVLQAQRRGSGDDLDAKARALSAIGSQRFPTPHATIRQRLARAQMRGCDSSGAARQLAAILATGDRRSLLQRICCPTTVLHGDEDRLIPSEGGMDQARHIQGARFELIHGMGHDFPPPLLSRIARLLTENLATAQSATRFVASARSAG
mgnify:CR=1 FL=1